MSGLEKALFLPITSNIIIIIITIITAIIIIITIINPIMRGKLRNKDGELDESKRRVQVVQPIDVGSSKI